MANSDRWPRAWTAYAIVSLTLLAPLLGGSTEFWAKATLVLLTGILFVAAPPTRSLGIGFTAIFVSLAVLPLIGSLPARIFAQPQWRTDLTALGITLPATWSPQPWLTFEAACLLWLGLAWTYYLFTYEWKPRLREKVWDVFCLGILCLSAALVIGYTFRLRIPFWPNVPEFGFFPNRNQTSNVLGLGGVFMYANAFRHLQQGRRRGWLWLAGLALVCWALILNYSRGGIILFFAGAFAWHICWLLTSRGATGRIVAWAPLAILLALLLLTGGSTLMRFRNASSDLLFATHDGRLAIHRDALAFFGKSPLLGLGLGNFRSLFTAERQFFTSSSEAIHPESDWLWFAVEVGALGPILLLIGLSLWIRLSFPFAAGTWRTMRMAALICGIGLAIHGIFDVSAHRLGSLWPGVFLASMAINPERKNRGSLPVETFYQVLGPAFLAIGVWWLVSLVGATVGPTSARLARILKSVEKASASSNFERAFALSNVGLKIAPLNWPLYYHRGVAEAGLSRPNKEISRDFSVARYLLPNWPELFIKEGIVWLGIDEPDLAFEVWQQGMERWPENAPTIYADIFGVIKNDPQLRERWRQLGYGDSRCFPILLQSTNTTEFLFELERLLAQDPELHMLTSQDLSGLFSAWYEKGDKLRLIEALRSHPEWEKIAWRKMARAFGDYKDYRQAYETASRFSTPPALPSVDPGQVPLLNARFHVGGDIGNDGLQLATAQFQSGAADDALLTVEIATTAPRAPRALHYIAARLWAEKGNWQKAWQSMAKYDQIFD